MPTRQHINTVLNTSSINTQQHNVVTLSHYFVGGIRQCNGDMVSVCHGRNITRARESDEVFHAWLHVSQLTCETLFVSAFETVRISYTRRSRDLSIGSVFWTGICGIKSLDNWNSGQILILFSNMKLFEIAATATSLRGPDSCQTAPNATPRKLQKK